MDFLEILIEHEPNMMIQIMLKYGMAMADATNNSRQLNAADQHMKINNQAIIKRIYGSHQEIDQKALDILTPYFFFSFDIHNSITSSTI